MVCIDGFDISEDSRDDCRNNNSDNSCHLCQMRTLDTCPELRQQGMDVLCALATQLGRSYECFIPIVHRITIRHKITHPRYDILVAKVVKVRGALLTS